MFEILEHLLYITGVILKSPVSRISIFWSFNSWANAWQNQQNDCVPSEDSDQLCAQWVARDPSFRHAHIKDSDQTGQMPRLIWVFAGGTDHFVLFCHEVAQLGKKQICGNGEKRSSIFYLCLICVWRSVIGVDKVVRKLFGAKLIS